MHEVVPAGNSVPVCVEGHHLLLFKRLHVSNLTLTDTSSEDCL